MGPYSIDLFLAFCVDTFLDVCELYNQIPVWGSTLLLFICSYSLLRLIIEEFLGEERDDE